MPILLGCLLLINAGKLAAQNSLGDYQTVANGAWTTVGTWQVYNGTSFVALSSAAAGSYQNVIPQNSASPPPNNVNLRNNVTISSGVDITIDQLTLTSGTLTIGAGRTLKITDGSGDDFTNLGGTITVTGTLIINDNAVFNHARNGGAIPLATWNPNSTCMVTGILNTSPALSATANYQYFTWSCPSQSATITLAGNLRSVTKDLLIDDTNDQQLRFATTQVYTLNIGGDFTVQNTSRVAFCTTASGVVINATGNFGYASNSVAGSLLKSSGTYSFTMNDFSQTGGSITASTAGGAGTFNIKGIFDQAPGTTLTETGAGSGLLAFNGTGGTQTISAAGTISGTINVQVNNASGGVQLLTDLNLGGALTETAGDVDLNGLALTVNGNFTQSSGNIIVDPNSSFILQGTGTLPVPAVSFSGSALGTLTVNQTGTLTITSPLTLTNLNLLSGTVSSSSITMDTDGQVLRTTGTISATPAGTDYDLTYNIAVATNTGPEMPSSATLLRNLTKLGAGTLTLSQALVTVNGDFTTSAGTFACGGNSVTVYGNFISNAALTTAAGSTFTFAGPSSTLSGAVAPTFTNVSVTGTFTPSSNYRVNGNYSVGAAGTVVDGGAGLLSFGGTTVITNAHAGFMNLHDVTILAGSAVTAPATDMTIDGNFVITNGTSTFTHNSGTVIFGGTTVLSGTGTKTFFNVTVNPSSSLSASGTVAWGVNGALVNNGTLNFSVSTGNTTFGGATGTLSGSQSSQFGPVVISGGNTLTTSSDFSCTTLNINAAGILTANSNFSMTGNFTGTGNFSSTGAVTFAGGTTSMTGAGTKVFHDIIVNNGATFSPTVSFTINGNMTFNGTGDMADPNNTHTITIDGAPTTIAGAGTGTIIFDGLTINATKSLVFNRDITVDNTLTATGNISSAANAITFTGLTMSGAGTISFHDVVVGTGNFTPNANYSISGNLTVNGTLLAGNSTTTFNGTTTIAGAGGTTFNFLTITGTLTSDAGTISVVRDFTNNGTFNHANGTVTFSTAGVVQQQILGSSSTTFYNLIVSNVGVATDLVNAVPSPQTVSIAGTLSFAEANAVIDADGTGTSVLTILSTADNPVGDGRIASTAAFAGDAVSGNVTVQRYMSDEGGSNSPGYNNGRIYRYLSTPVQNPPISQWQDDFYVTGTFPGADNGTTPGCTGCTTNPSVYYYDSSVPNYVAFPGGNILTGVGYAAFIRNNLVPPGGGTAGQPIVVDVTGPINSGAITIPNISSNSANWNLVGNPYPSPIAWNNAGAGSTNIAAGIAIRDNGTGTAGGILVPLGVGAKIATGQAFWVRANFNGAATLVINESDKTTVDASTIFYRTQQTIQDQLSIKVVRNDGKYDESFLSINAQSSQGLDQYDIPKKNDANDLNNDFIDITTASSDGISMLQNAIPQLNCAQPVQINFYDQLVTGSTPLASATFTISINPTGAFAAVKWILHDAYTGTTNDFSVNPVYNFTIDGSITASTATGRFTLVASSNALNTALSVTGPANSCAGTDPSVLIGSSQNAVTYSAEVNGTLYPNLAQGTGNDLTLFVTDAWLQNGSNTIRILANSGCDQQFLASSLTISRSALADPIATSGPALCKAGSILLSASGAPSGATYNWYDVQTAATPLATGNQFNTPVISDSTTYYVSIVNAAGCEGSRVAVTAAVNNSAASLSVLVYPAAICSGDATTLTVSGPNGGTFNWYDAPDATAPITSGATFQTPVLTRTTNYYVSYTDGTGCLGDKVLAVATVNRFSPVLYADPLVPVVCKGGVHTLTAKGAPAGSVYQWYEDQVTTSAVLIGDKLTTVPLDASKTYYLTATNQSGCTTDRYAVTAVVDSSDPMPSFNVTQSSTICQNDANPTTLVLAPKDPSNVSYKWYDSPSSESVLSQGLSFKTAVIDYSNAGYYVTAVNGNGCEGTTRIAVPVKVTNFPTVSIDTTLSNAGILKSSSASGNQWYFNDQLMPGETSQTLAVRTPGPYNVKVSLSGCSDWATSVMATTLVTGLDEPDRVIQVYPNPSMERVTIFVEGDEPVTGQLYDEEGRAVQKVPFAKDDLGWRGEMDVRQFAKGLYLLRLYSDTKSVTHKLIVK